MLVATVTKASQARVRYMQERIRKNTKYASGVIIIPEAQEPILHHEKKNQHIVEVAPNTYKNMTTTPITPLQATAIERAVAEALKISEEDVTITTAPRPEKMLPDEVRLYNGEKPNGFFFGEHPDVRSALQRETCGAQHIRVGGNMAKSCQRTIAEKSERVNEIVTACLQR